jgi:hypothetical protein
MQKIAIFYHCILKGGSVPINTASACKIMAEQMAALDKSGLLAEADEFHIGINGDESDMQVARLFVPCPNAKFILHGSGVTTELLTLGCLRRWLSGHPDWYVLYHHIKGVTNPGKPLFAQWRHCMERACVWDWKRCVTDLEQGADTVGCHWLTPETHGKLVKSPYFGGTFWWATAKYLLMLPPLPAATWANRFEAESWIGYGPSRPKVVDYHPVPIWRPWEWNCCP